MKNNKLLPKLLFDYKKIADNEEINKYEYMKIIELFEYLIANDIDKNKKLQKSIIDDEPLFSRDISIKMMNNNYKLKIYDILYTYLLSLFSDLEFNILYTLENNVENLSNQLTHHSLDILKFLGTFIDELIFFYFEHFNNFIKINTIEVLDCFYNLNKIYDSMVSSNETKTTLKNVNKIIPDIVIYLDKLYGIKSNYNHELVNLKANTAKLTKNEIKNLEKKIELLTSDNIEKSRLENELEDKNALYESQLEIERNLKIENKKLKENKSKIDNAINRLKRPAKELRRENIYNKRRRKYYTDLAEVSFTITGIIFALFIIMIYYENFSTHNLKDINISVYFFSIFPIIFTTFIGFLFLRQSNIKSKEIKEIDKRFILIHDVNNSLKAMLEIKADITDKTETIIEKLIENIMNYANSDSQKVNDINYFELIDNLNTKINSMSRKSID